MCVPQDIDVEVAAIEGVSLYSVCWGEPMLWEHGRERFAMQF